MDDRLCNLYNRVVQFRIQNVVASSNESLQQKLLTECKELQRIVDNPKSSTSSDRKLMYTAARNAIEKVNVKEDPRAQKIIESSQSLLRQLESLNNEFKEYLAELDRLYLFYFKELRSDFKTNLDAVVSVFANVRKQFQATQNTLTEWKANQLTAVMVEEQKSKSDLRDWCTHLISYLNSVEEMLRFFLVHRAKIRFDYERSRRTKHNRNDPPKSSHTIKLGDIKALKPKEVHALILDLITRLQQQQTSSKKTEIFPTIYEALVVCHEISVSYLQPTRQFILKNEQRVAEDLKTIDLRLTQQRHVVDELHQTEQVELSKVSDHLSEHQMAKHRMLQDDITSALKKLDELMLDQHEIQSMLSEMDHTIQAAKSECPSVEQLSAISRQMEEITKQNVDITNKYKDKQETAEKDFQRHCHTLVQNVTAQLLALSANAHLDRQREAQELWNTYQTNWLNAQEKLVLLERHLVQRRNMDFKGSIEYLLLQLDGIVGLTRQFQEAKRAEAMHSHTQRFLFLLKKTIRDD